MDSRDAVKCGPSNNDRQEHSNIERYYPELVAEFPEEGRKLLVEALAEAHSGVKYQMNHEVALATRIWAMSVLQREEEQEEGEEKEEHQEDKINIKVPQIYEDVFAGLLLCRSQSGQHREKEYLFSPAAYGKAKTLLYPSQIVASQLFLLNLWVKAALIEPTIAVKMIDLLYKAFTVDKFPTLMTVEGLTKTWNQDSVLGLAMRWGKSTISLDEMAGSIHPSPTCSGLLDVLIDDNHLFHEEPSKLHRYYRISEVFEEPVRFTFAQRLFAILADTIVELKQKIDEERIRTAVCKLMAVHEYMISPKEEVQKHGRLKRIAKIISEILAAQMISLSDEEKVRNREFVQLFLDGGKQCCCLISIF